MTGTEELIATALDTTAASFRRRMAIPDLARSSDPRALAALSQLLQDQDRYLRREVVASLAGLREQRVVEPLLQALNDSDDYIRRDAIEALSKLGDRRALAPLQTLADEAPYAVRDAAQRALQELHRRGIQQPARGAEEAHEAQPPRGEAVKKSMWGRCRFDGAWGFFENRRSPNR